MLRSQHRRTPHLHHWLDAMKERPVCQRGGDVPLKVDALTNEKFTRVFAPSAQQMLQR